MEVQMIYEGQEPGEDLKGFFSESTIQMVLTHLDRLQEEVTLPDDQRVFWRVTPIQYTLDESSPC